MTLKNGFWGLLLLMLIVLPTSAQFTLTQIDSMAWNPSGTLLAVSGMFEGQGGIRIYDESGALLQTFNTPLRFLSVSWSHNETKVAGQSSNLYTSWDITQVGTPTVTFQQSAGTRDPFVYWNPVNANQIATIEADFVYIRDASNGQIQATLDTSAGLPDSVLSVGWSLDGRTLYTVSTSNSIRIWDVSSMSNVTLTSEILLNYPVGAFSMSPDATQLAVASTNNVIYLYNTTGGLLSSLDTLPDLATRTNITFLRWHPDGTHLAGVDNEGIHLWDIETGKLVNTIPHIVDFPSLTGITFHPNGSLTYPSGDTNNLVILAPVAAAGNDQTISDTNGNGVETVNLDGSGSIDSDGNIATYTWSENGTPVATSVNPQVSLGIGVHDIILTVTDNEGATSGDVVVITVEAPSVVCNTTVAASDVTALKNAIGNANTLGTPQTLCLEGTYSLTAYDNNPSDGANGLPVIEGNITLYGLGSGATITRSSGAPSFRIGKVDTGGRLVLHNITLSNGSPGGSHKGGAIRNLGTLELINATFTDNTSANDGGAIFSNNDSTLIITGSTFSNNTSAISGGAVYSNTGSSTTITDSDFSNNAANLSSGLGGALYMNGASLSITGGSFDNNDAKNGGGIYVGTVSGANPALIDGVSLINNTATNHGGAVYINAGQVTMNSVNVANNSAGSVGGGIRNLDIATLSITGDSVIQNNNGGSSNGGGIANYGTLTIDNTELLGNYGTGTNFNGGGLYTTGTLNITNSLIDGTLTGSGYNARLGGGLFVNSGTATISDSSIIDNKASADGGGIHVTSSSGTVDASGVILNNNQAGDDGGGLSNLGVFTFTNGRIENNQAVDKGGGVYSDTATSSVLNYSCIVSNTAATNGAIYNSNSIDLDAQFNWWGGGAPAAGQVSSHVNTSGYDTTSCENALSGGGGSLAATQSSTNMTISTTTAPYETSFDDNMGWWTTGTWAQEMVGGRAGGAWVVDATIRDRVSSLEMNVAVNLGNNPDPRVRYWQRGTLASSDNIMLEILPQGATTWVMLDQQSGFTSSWTQREIDLSSYRGQAVRLRWTLTTVGEVPEGQSSIDYAIDDLAITSRR